MFVLVGTRCLFSELDAVQAVADSIVNKNLDSSQLFRSGAAFPPLLQSHGFDENMTNIYPIISCHYISFMRFMKSSRR